MTNIALSFAPCYICHSTLTSSCIFHTNWQPCLSNTYRTVVPFDLPTQNTINTLKDVITKDIPLKLLNKHMGFWDNKLILQYLKTRRYKYCTLYNNYL